MSDAVAFWGLGNTEDAVAPGSVLQAEGGVEFRALKGDDAKASRLSGGDGLAAYFNQGCLNAGQGTNGELNLTGGNISILVRFKADQNVGYSTIVSKDGTDQSVAYKVALNSDGNSMTIEATIGSDEIAGAHQLNYSVPADSQGNWQDVILRFNGHLSELFVNGVLRDDEVTDGKIRDWNTHPVLIGKDFTGLIDHVALWNRCLDDEEIASLSGVNAISEGKPEYYSEEYRPQFHFTAQKNWINDPNGLVWYNGEWHMFFQYMPPHRPGAYKDWGHAVSTDLVHWTQTKEGQITPHKVWAGCWSGSAVIDENNVAGLQTGEDKTMIAYITNGGNPESGLGPTCTQCIAYSTDGGKSFTYYDGNPLINTIIRANRDPKVVWDEEHQIWVMSLYLDRGAEYTLFTSKNLLDWERVSDFTLEGDWECPGFMPLPLDGKDQGKWMFYGARGIYQIGTFDGKTFHPETKPVRMDYGKNFYAAQTWNNSPDGRCIHLAWMAYKRYPGMPFDEQMNFPTELTLRTTPDGIKVCRVPVREIATLYDKEYVFENQDLVAQEYKSSEINKDLYDMSFEFVPGSDFDLNIRGAVIHYNAASRMISVTGPVIDAPVADLGSASVRLTDGVLKLRVLVDRTTIEVFGNDGETVITSNFMPASDNYNYSLVPAGKLHLVRSEIHSLKSAWVN